jgi:hypothetical protein
VFCPLLCGRLIEKIVNCGEAAWHNTSYQRHYNQDKRKAACYNKEGQNDFCAIGAGFFID